MSDTHWHTLMLGGIDKPSGTRSMLEARPTLQEARDYLADVLADLPDPPGMSAADTAQFYADLRAGKWDWVSDDTMAMKVYPCKGANIVECRDVADVFARAIVRGKLITRLACMCPDHVAARAKTPRMPDDMTGLFGLLAAASMFTAAMDPDPETGMYL